MKVQQKDQMIPQQQQRLNILLTLQDQEKNCLSLYYNRSNSLLVPDDVKINQFKGKDSEIKAYPWCLGNISKDFKSIT